MFPLFTKIFPKNAAELESILNDSVNRLFVTPGDPVTVIDKKFPELASVRIVLDEAKFRSSAGRPLVPSGKGSPAISVDHLQIDGSGMSLGPARADLSLSAQDVRLSQTQEKDEEILLLLTSAAEGKLEVGVAQESLEEAIAIVAKKEAAKHGVTISQVELTMRARGTHGLDAEVRLRAQKLFFSTVVRVTAQLDLDEQLNAVISGLACHGEGAIAALACNFLEPHLSKVNGRTFPLMALPLGEIRLRDVRMAANDRLTVTAQFGS